MRGQPVSHGSSALPFVGDRANCPGRDTGRFQGVRKRTTETVPDESPHPAPYPDPQRYSFGGQQHPLLAPTANRSSHRFITHPRPDIFDGRFARPTVLLNAVHSVWVLRHPFGEGRRAEAIVEQARRLLAS